MAEHGIGWLNRPGTIGQSWSPMVGCSRVSEGCRHCYAEALAARIANAAAARLRRGETITATQAAYMRAVRWSGGEVGEGTALPRWSGHVELVPELLAQPLRWRRLRTVFPSMTDPFHEGLTDEQIAATFGVMAAAQVHTFLILTKRPGRAAAWLRGPGEELAEAAGDHLAADQGWCHANQGEKWPLPNVWLGCSVEDQPTADARIPHLLRCPAAVRFVSYEPALGPLSWRWAKWDDGSPHPRRKDQNHYPPVERGGRLLAGSHNHLDGLRMLDWIIVGGESGPGARPFDLAWARSTIEQCREAGVPCYVKQLGSRPFAVEGSQAARSWAPNGVDGVGVMDDCGQIHLHDSKGADPSEWPEDLPIQQWPEVAAA